MTESNGGETADRGGRPRSDDEGDVRIKYLEARRNEHSFQGMVLARHVAEAICSSLEFELPDGERRLYQGKDLNGRLGFLEDKARKQEIDTPRAIVAALRTLQAYGNYASHHEPGTHTPPERAMASAMASLALVAQWFLQRDPEHPATIPELPLREPAPRTPGFLERRGIVWSIPLNVPDIQDSGTGRFIVSAYDPAETQLGTLYAYYGRVVEVCAGVARTVLEREATLDPTSMSLPQLTLHLAQVSNLRPARVPRSICSAIEEVERQQAAVSRALQRGEADARPFVVDARQSSPAETVVNWFRRDYLGQGPFEQNWLRFVILMPGVCFLVWLFYELGVGWGEQQEDKRVRRALVSEFCGSPAIGSQRLCQRLNEFAPPGSGSAAPASPAR
jgi:hypothetical protein